VSKGKYATVIGKYMIQLDKRNRLLEKYKDKLLDWYSTFELVNS